MNRTGKLDREPVSLRDSAAGGSAMPWPREPDCRRMVHGSETVVQRSASALSAVADREAEDKAVGLLAGCTHQNEANDILMGYPLPVSWRGPA